MNTSHPVAYVLVCALFLVPTLVLALGNQADLFCGTQYCYPGKCTPSQPGCRPCPSIACTDITNGATTGTCVNSIPGQCLGKSSQGLNGASSALQGIGTLLQGIASLMQAMKGSPSSGGAAAVSPVTTASACPNGTRNVTVPSSDPCDIYQAPVSGSLGTADTSALDALGNAINSSGQDTISSLLGNTANTSGLDATLANASGSPVASGGSQVTQLTDTTKLTPGLRGDIVVNADGATVVGANRDVANNTETSGFYGADNPGSAAPTSIAQSICASRPWAASLVAYLIPVSFFDSLCTWRGYTVGQPKPVVQTTDAPAAETKKTQPAATTTPAKVYDGPAGTVKIWAVPASVPVGSRTSIFWNSQNVESCLVTSPDGSFNETALSGGASTVPLSGATTFSMSCMGLDGNPATGSVTVQMSI